MRFFNGQGKARQGDELDLLYCKEEIPIAHEGTGRGVASCTDHTTGTYKIEEYMFRGSHYYSKHYFATATRQDKTRQDIGTRVLQAD